MNEKKGVVMIPFLCKKGEIINEKNKDSMYNGTGYRV